MKRLFLIDAMAFIYRGYYALIKHPRTTSGGFNTSAILGFFNTFLEILRKENPTHLGVAFDTQGPTTRHLQFINYKANRERTPEDILNSIPYIKKLLELLHVPVFASEGYEADDVIGTLSVKASAAGYDVYVVTPDKDFGQIVSSKIFMYKPAYSSGGFSILGEREVCEKFGIKSAKQMIELLGLWGDASDNIPGVPGIGETTARRLLEKFDNIDNLYAHIDEVDNEKLRLKLLEYKEQAFESRMLATIILDVPIDFNEERLRMCAPDMPEVKKILNDLEMVSFSARLTNYYDNNYGDNAADSTDSAVPPPVRKSPKNNVPDLFSSIESEQKQEKQEQITMPSHVTMNLKSQLHVLAAKGIFIPQEEQKEFFDIRIASYLLNPETPVRAFDTSYADKLKSLLKKQDLENFFYNIEMPLTWVLFEMEREGIKIDKEVLRKFSISLAEQIGDIEKQVFLHAGHEFNIASPQQLGTVLFEELKISEKVKRTKINRQYSTAEEVLEKLGNKHPIIPLVLQHRKLVKLKSTYVDSLPLLADNNDRIHTTYNQTATATGRLSSVSPNLQNIPIRTELGREIRRAFIADTPDDLLMSADYSQIELRIVAAMSGDPTMLADFAAGHDIHTATAANVFGTQADMVSSEMRRRAKAVNFGIVYGMSAHGLSERLKISVREAASIISKYFTQYSKLKEFLDSIIAFARRKGYVETLWGRRRYTPDVRSANGIVRAAAERYAINAPIQGTAADMLKVAMVEIARALREANLQSKMLLQVHDELVFNVKKCEEATVREIVNREMLKAGERLNVPLEIEIKTAYNWLDAH
ncbi:MAG: DNA polymerase I [Bacteroidales bacterium]|jgi:DNA polymerase-1|nr:DNA polymerase I [Bacteroidales bacterium]